MKRQLSGVDEAVGVVANEVEGKHEDRDLSDEGGTLQSEVNTVTEKKSSLVAQAAKGDDALGSSKRAKMIMVDQADLRGHMMGQSQLPYSQLNDSQRDDPDVSMECSEPC